MQEAKHSIRSYSSKQWLGALCLMLILCIIYLIFDHQYMLYKREKVELSEEIEASAHLLEQATSYAQDSDHEMARINELISESRGKLIAELGSYVKASQANNEIERLIIQSMVGKIKVVELTSLNVREREFFREHKYKVIFEGEREDITAAAKLTAQSPLLLSWNAAKSSIDRSGAEFLTLEFSAYSVIGGLNAADLQTLPACKSRDSSTIWLPWLQRYIHYLEERRTVLCEQSRHAPLSTASVLLSNSLVIEARHLRIMREIIGGKCDDLLVIITKARESANGYVCK